MEKEFGASNKLQVYPDLLIIRKDPADAEKTLALHSYKEIRGFINIKTITTPLINLPLSYIVNRSLKRSFDIVFSAIVIVGVLSWLIPIVALFIWFDSKGPVFFLQKRNKRNNELFTCIKFRSMLVNADADILPATRFDKRITRVGRFLRNHYIDELPQFFNVLLGDMSIMGPRPHMLSDDLKYEEEIEHYAQRYNVKPGITGLAQVLGYVGPADDITTMKGRVNMDIFYLRHWSFKMDMIILWKTVRKIFRP